MRYLLALLLAGCMGASGAAEPDAGVRQDEWDGHCYGRKGDAGKRALWLHTVYICRDNGPPNHWYFVQDPDFYGVRM